MMVPEEIRLIHGFLEKSAEIYPEKTAFVQGDVRISYSKLNTMSNWLSMKLTGLGVKSGDRIVILQENGLPYVVSYYGILKTGGVAVPVNTESKPDGLVKLLMELEPTVLIATSKFERLLSATDLELTTLKSVIVSDPKLEWNKEGINREAWSDIVKTEEVENPVSDIKDDDLASIIYTSGSTGDPKGVMLTHGNVVSNTVSICKYLSLTKNDVQMVVLPFFYVMGKSLLNTHFAVGGTIVVNNQFAYPAKVVEEIIKEGVTGFSGVPSTFAYLLHRSTFRDKVKEMTSLRYCSQAGGHMSRTLKKELRESLPDEVAIYIMYGATEASARLAYMEYNKTPDKIESIGRAIPDVDLKVLDINGNEVPIGEIGELVAAGPNIMQGYWKDASTTKRVLGENGYHTGDLCTQDEDGFFFLVGRKDNLIKVGGHRINPKEIEESIMETGVVIEAVVMGIEDEMLGNKLVAAVVTKDGQSTENDILSACSKVIPREKIPGTLKIVRTLPKSPSGKINMNRCREMFLG